MYYEKTKKEREENGRMKERMKGRKNEKRYDE